MGRIEVVAEGSAHTRRRALVFAGLLLHAGCAAGGAPIATAPGDALASARGPSPLTVAAEGTAALLADDGDGAPDGALGSAVCLAPGLVACAAHALPGGARWAWIRPTGRGHAAARVAVLARGTAADVAFLADDARHLAPVAGEPVRPGERVWAMGHPTIGPAVASGAVEFADAVLPGFGRGFTARLPALMGYSGGPVVGEDGLLRGLVSALPEPRGALALARLAGFDLAGPAAGSGPARRVFALSVETVFDEAARLGLV